MKKTILCLCAAWMALLAGCQTQQRGGYGLTAMPGSSNQWMPKTMASPRGAESVNTPMEASGAWKTASMPEMANVDVVLENTSASKPESSPGTEKLSSAPPPYETVKVFYGTDRKPSGSADPVKFYTDKRSDGGQLHFGKCFVSIPRNHKKASLASYSLWKAEFKNTPEKHVTLLKVKSLEKEVFTSELQAEIARAKKNEIFVFIHGYNVSFEDAARRTAQLSYDLEFRGVPVLYSWPSQNKLLEYFVDDGNNRWTVPHLEKFLKQLAAESGASTIHLVAHSMGNQAMANALERIALSSSLERPLFNQIVMAAPDIDVDEFEQLSEQIRKTGEHLTLYACSKDVALEWSRKFREHPRLGNSGKEMVVRPVMDSIDVSFVDTSLLGHSYVTSNE
mgnify:FL=1